MYKLKSDTIKKIKFLNRELTELTKFSDVASGECTEERIKEYIEAVEAEQAWHEHMGELAIEMLGLLHKELGDV